MPCLLRNVRRACLPSPCRTFVWLGEAVPDQSGVVHPSGEPVRGQQDVTGWKEASAWAVVLFADGEVARHHQGPAKEALKHHAARLPSSSGREHSVCDRCHPTSSGALTGSSR